MSAQTTPDDDGTAPAVGPEAAAGFFDYDNPEWYRAFLQHLRYGFLLTEYPILAQHTERFLNQTLSLPAPRPADPERIAADVAKLKTDGWCALGRLLDDDQLAAARDHLESAEMTDDLEVVATPFTRAEAPAEVNIGNFDAAAVVAAPHLAHVANRADVLARVAGFLGVPPTIQYFAAWWSFAGRPAPKGAQSYHIDRACYRFLKLFVFLTDVTEESGPHCYVQGSADPREWARRVEVADRRNPKAAQLFRGMLTAKRKSDRLVTAFFGKDRVTHLTGRAGEAFLVNTAGYHKGVLPRTRDRLVFQALYTMLPTIKHGAPRASCPGFYDTAADACPGVEESYLRYVNRLVIADG